MSEGQMALATIIGVPVFLCLVWALSDLLIWLGFVGMIVGLVCVVVTWLGWRDA